MGRELFGACLRRVVQLTHHDVSEILEEQGATGRRFGEVALSLRLCQPEDVWQAWWEQLGQVAERIDLNLVGVDAQALAHVPRALAEEFGVIPMRAVNSQLVVAVSDDALPLAQAHFAQRLGKEVRFVVAAREQIRDAAARYYSKSSTAQRSSKSEVAATR